MAKKSTSNGTEYTVAPGNSYTSGGVVYGPGDKIPASLFGDSDFLQAQVDAGKLVAIATTTAAASASASADGSGAASSSGDAAASAADGAK
jgi:hypothetical protein